MKYRNGFVSNSSSSSYTCDICGETESGRDLCLCDVDMVTCVNGHCFHTGCAEDPKEKVQKMIDNGQLPEHIECPEDYLGEEYPYDLKEEFCPMCQFEELAWMDMMDFFMMYTGMSRKDVLQEIKTKCRTYAEFKKAINKYKSEKNEAS